MPLGYFGGVIDEKASLPQLLEEFARLQKEIAYLLNGGLDTLNVLELNAEVIIANTITANKMNVTQLSAIAADLGTITAGIIYGAYIATANGTYPRVEMSSTDNLFAAYVNANQSIKISPVYSGGSPSILFYEGGAVKGNMAVPTGGGLGITSSGTTNISLQSAQDVSIASNRDVILDPTGNLKIGTSNGFTGTFDVVDGVNFVAQTVTYTRVTVKKGIITNVALV